MSSRTSHFRGDLLEGREMFELNCCTEGLVGDMAVEDVAELRTGAPSDFAYLEVAGVLP